MNYEERRSHAQGVYPTQDTSRMGTAKVNQEEDAYTRMMVIEGKEMWKKKIWELKGKVPNNAYLTLWS